MPEAPSSGALPSRTDVVVVGGGIAGASAAYHCAAAGLDVVLVERGQIGGGATGAAVGVLSPPLRQPFHETVRALGPDAASELWRFALRSVEDLARLLREHGKAGEAGLDLRGGFVLAEEYSQRELTRSFGALQEAGLPVRALSAEDVRMRTGGRGFVGGFEIEGLGALRPGATAQALAALAAQEGAWIVERSAVTSMEPAGAGFDVETEAGTLRADRIIHATHIDAGRFVPHLGREVVAIRGQGFVTEPMEPRFQGALATHWKLNVWRQDPTGSLVVSGWRHDAWQRSYGERELLVDDRLQDDLQRWFEAAFPDLAPLRVERRWSGLFGWTADFLPLVGGLPGSPGQFAVTGFSGGGLPFAFEAGRLLSRLLTGAEPVPGSHLFDPARFVRG